VITPDSPEAWLTGLGVTFPAIKDDAAYTINDLYETTYYPYTCVIGRDMVIRDTPYVSSEEALEGSIMDVAYMRDPLDVEMVMDVSDSMNSPSPSDPGGDSKLIMMRQAATMIADFLHDHGQVDDRMGLVWFTDDASEYEEPVSHDKLLSVQTYWASLRTQIETRETGTCTAMGAGLQTAFDTLDAEGMQDRFVILCTDGMQNIEPKVAPVGGHFEIIDSGGWLCGGHSGAPPHPGVDITSYDARIHPIGIGITATYEGLLQDIANATGGFYRGTDDPDVDLDLIYFLDLCNCMAGGSPAVVHHNAGKFYPEKCQAIESFYLNRSARKVTAMLSWKRAQGSNLTFWLRAPDGSLLDLHRQMRLFEDHCLATFYLPRRRNGKELPHVGEWRMIVRGETAGSYADYHAFVIAEDREVKYYVDYPRKVYAVGDRLPITIKLTELKEPVLKVKEILVEMAHQRVPLEELLAEYQPSVKPEEMGIKEYPKEPTLLKLVAMTVDPKFREQLKPVRSRLSLQAKEIECQIGKESIVVPLALKQSGLHSFKVAVHCETSRNGPIRRLDLVSVHVTPGKAAL
jgi:hypothetical protein